jgi:hypothetical protein
MAKAGSKGKYNRGKARARARRAPRRSGSAVWSVAMAVIVVLGVGGIILSMGGDSSNGGAGLKIGDHWHAAFGLNVCGSWLPNPPETPRDSSGNIVRHGTDIYAGIHTHADGLIHFEPNSSDDAGKNATVGRYFTYNGWSLSSTSFAYDKGVSKKNGDACPAANGSAAGKGTLSWAVNGKAHSGDLAKYTPHNNDRIVLAFLPPGKTAASLGDPPSVAALPNANQSEGGATTPTSGAPSTGSPTTVPATTAPATTATTAKP